MKKSISLVISVVVIVSIAVISFKIFVLNSPKESPQKVVTEYLYMMKQEKLDFIRSPYVSDSALITNLANLKTYLNETGITKFIFSVMSANFNQNKTTADVLANLQLDPIERKTFDLKLPTVGATFRLDKEGSWLKGYQWKIRDVSYSETTSVSQSVMGKETIQETTPEATANIQPQTLSRPEIEPPKPQEVTIEIKGFEIIDSLLINKGNRGITNTIIVLLDNKDETYGLYQSEFTVNMKDNNNNTLSINKAGRYGTPIINVLPPLTTIPVFSTFDMIDDRAISISVTNTGNWRDFSKVTIPLVNVLSSEYKTYEAGDKVLGEIQNKSKKIQDIDVLISIFDKQDKLVNGGVVTLKNVASNQIRTFEAEMIVQNPGFRMDVLALPQHIDGF